MSSSPFGISSHYEVNQMIADRDFNHHVSTPVPRMNESLATSFLIDTCISAIIFNQTHYSARTINCSLRFKMAEGAWHWWLDKIGSLVIGSLGLFGNLICFIVFSTSKTFKCSSYIYYLKFLSLVDAICLLIESVKSLNDILIHIERGFYLYDKTEWNCKLIGYFTSTFHLTSAWIICAFSIERCMVVVFPFYNRRTSIIRKTNLICVLIFVFALLIQAIRLLFTDTSCLLPPYKKYNPEDYATNKSLFGNSTNHSELGHFLTHTRSSQYHPCYKSVVSEELGKFLIKFYSYFNQLICLVIIPSLIIITCNSIVFLRIIQRIRMVNSGNFHNFKINKSSIPKIQVSKFINGNNDSNPSMNGRAEGGEPVRHNSNPLSNTSTLISTSSFTNSNGHQNRLKASTSLATGDKKNAETSRLEADSFATNDDELHSYSYSFSTTQHDEINARYALGNGQEVSFMVSTKSGNNGLDLSKKSAKRSRVSTTRRTKKSIQRSNRNRDIRLGLLMIFSASMLFFVLPESLLNIYQYHTLFYDQGASHKLEKASSSLPNAEKSSKEILFKCVNIHNKTFFYYYQTADVGNGPSNLTLTPPENHLEFCMKNVNEYLQLAKLIDLFHLLKIINYSSNFLAYLALLKFGKGRRTVHRKIERSSNLK